MKTAPWHSPIRLVQMQRLLSRLFPHFQIQHFHADAERHGKVDVTLRDLAMEAFGDERHTNQEQKAQRKYLNRWMFLDEGADVAAKHQHKTHGENHGRDRK